MKFLIVIPTYNEIENLEPLLKQIFGVVDSSAKECGVEKVGVLVVDDNSPDGTGKLADQLSTKDSRVQVLHRTQKNGLGRAYLAGFAWGLQNGYDVICEMDADFSHNPVYLKDFWRLLKTNDVVIGSRYVPGGGTRNWGLVRKFISRGGSCYARTILGMKIRDMTGGFNAWKRHALEGIDLPTVQSEGYSFQIELKWRASLRGFKIAETPIIFEDRTLGKSKMSKKIVLEGMWRVAKMRLRPEYQGR